ncbi:MAG: hypothetical protein ACMUIU_16355 [bacterium]
MLSSKGTEIIFKEFLFIFMGFFMITAIAEINKPQVVIRIPSEFFLIAFYSFSLYFMILSIRIIFWTIKKCIYSYNHSEVEEVAKQYCCKRQKVSLAARFTEIISLKGKFSKIVKPLYAIQKIRSLF